MELIKKESTKEYRDELKKRKTKAFLELDDFVASPAFDEFFNKYIKSVLDRISYDILNDESENENKIAYSRKVLKIMLRKELAAIYQQPVQRLKLLEKSLNTIGSTE